MFELLQPADLFGTSVSSEATVTSPAHIAPAQPCLQGQMSSQSDLLNTGLKWTGWNSCLCESGHTKVSSYISAPDCSLILRSPITAP